MSENDARVDALFKALHELPDNIKPADLIDIYIALVDKFIERDNGLRAENNYSKEAEVFKMLSASVNFYDRNYLIQDLIFALWLKSTPNPFAQAYKTGSKHEFIRNGLRTARRASNGRRLIGSTTRERVKGEAAKYMHLTKGVAANEIASAINLSPDRVRKLLSEIYPGNSWVVSADPTS